MNKVYIFSLFLIIMGCDGFNDPESPYIEKYVVFANLSGNKAMINDTVFVSRSASLDENIDAEKLWVEDAKVTISGDMIDVQAYPVSGRPGRYQTDKSIIYLPGKTYKLAVEVGGQVLSSKTTIPKSLNIDTKTDFTSYTCRDGTILSIPEINVNNMDENGEPIQGKVDTLLYNYGQCFTGSFASYPLFMLDFTIDDSSKLVRTLTYALESDSMDLEPEENGVFYDYNWNSVRDSTYINLIYDTSFVNRIWKGQYQRDMKNNPSRENPFVWSVETTPIRMSWLFFNYYGLQLITVQSTDKNYYNYLKGDPIGNNIYILPGSNIDGGYGLFSSDTSVSFYVYLKRGKDYSKDS